MERAGHREEERPSPSLYSSRTRHDRSPATAEEQIPASKRQHMEKVVRYVVFEDDGSDSEAILKKLLLITGNDNRWGFLSPDHPHHAYYTQRKAAVRRHRHSKAPCVK